MHTTGILICDKGNPEVEQGVRKFVLHRCRDGTIEKNELGVMVEDIRAFKEQGGVRGFVVGTLTKDGRVDVESMKM